jgi:hypothetical protein
MNNNLKLNLKLEWNLDFRSYIQLIYIEFLLWVKSSSTKQLNNEKYFNS